MIFYPFHFFNRIRVRRQGPFGIEIHVRPLPVLNRRISHFHGGLIQAAGAPLAQEDFFDHAVHGHLCGQQAHDHPHIGGLWAGKEGGLPLNPPVALPAQPFDFVPIVDIDASFTVQHNGF